MRISSVPSFCWQYADAGLGRFALVESLWVGVGVQAARATRPIKKRSERKNLLFILLLLAVALGEVFPPLLVICASAPGINGMTMIVVKMFLKKVNILEFDINLT